MSSECIEAENVLVANNPVGIFTSAIDMSVLALFVTHNVPTIGYLVRFGSYKTAWAHLLRDTTEPT